MVMGTGVKTAMSAWMFFERVLIAVVGLVCGLVFGRVRVVWVVVKFRKLCTLGGTGSNTGCNRRGMGGHLGGCTGPPVIELPLKYELMC